MAPEIEVSQEQIRKVKRWMVFGEHIGSREGYFQLFGDEEGKEAHRFDVDDHTEVIVFRPLYANGGDKSGEAMIASQELIDRLVADGALQKEEIKETPWAKANARRLTERQLRFSTST